MLRKLSSQLLHACKGSKSLSWQQPMGCQYAKRPGKMKEGKVMLSVAEEKMATEYLENMGDILKIRKKRIEREIEELKMVDMVPDHISAVQWKVLLTECNSMSKRQAYVRYLAKLEYKKENDILRKKEVVSIPIEQHRVIDELSYPSRTRVKLGQRYACYKSLVHGNPLVFDMNFESTRREETMAMDQALTCYGINLRHQFPFHLHFCGYKNTRFNTLVESEMIDEDMFATFYKDSFTDLFDRDKLVYLSPNGPLLKPYDANKTYVIGGYVDMNSNPNCTYGRAREMGIECGRFPLDQFVSLKKGKDLTLTAVLSIMLHVNMTNDWQEAIFNGLPPSHFAPLTEEQRMKRLMRKKPYLYKMYS